MDPLAMASSLDTSVPVSTDDVMGFDNYCIVCDRLIVPPKAPEVKQKKKAGGTITVKNADGTKTTRNANGKVTRPAIRRNPSSMNRLAAVAANNNVAKLLPLTRSKTTENASAASTEEPSPPPRTTPPSTPFHSSIYCSRECAQTDAGRSNEAYKDIARTLSYDFSLPHPPFASDGYHGISVGDRFNAHGPPSPIFISGSDTDSSVAGPDGPACSAPQTLGYFRMSREGPDEAWNEVQRQRRSSMHPIIRPGSLARPPSHLGNGHKGVGDLSTDSLSSLWHNTTTEAELYLARSPSNPGRSREGFNRRSMSSSSERSAAPVRPVARSNLSQTSLTASPPTQAVPIPPEFGSAPNHTVNLLQSYAAAFPVRDPSGTSQSQKGFVFPGSSVEARRPSHGAHSLSYGTPMTNLSRPVNGTIRAKSRQETWDSFGKTEMEARAKAAQPHADGAGCTPKQSLEMENGRWKVRYVSADLASSLDQRPGTIRQRSRSRSSGRSVTSHTGSNESDAAASGITIPSRQTLSTSYNSHHTANGRTPQQGPMAPPRSIPLNRASTTAPTTSPRPASSMPSRTQSHIPIPTLPDLAAMRIGAPTPLVGLSHDNASVPKSGFNWTEHEKKGGKTYELPKGLKIDRSKAGLFYFN